MFPLAPLAIALTILPTTLIAPTPANDQVPMHEDVLQLEITLSDDAEERAEAWGVFDAQTPAETDSLNLGDMRINYVGLAPAGFTTDTLFTIEDNEQAYVFSKVPASSPANIPLTSFSEAEQLILTYNLPTCDEDFTSSCLADEDTSVTF